MPSPCWCSYHAARPQPLSKKHGAFRRFAAAFRDAVFCVSPEAAEKVKKQLMEDRGMSQEEADQHYISDARHFVSKVERHVPDPDKLVEALEMVRLMFADCEDADTGKLLFCEETHKSNATSTTQLDCISSKGPAKHDYSPYAL